MTYILGCCGNWSENGFPVRPAHHDNQRMKQYQVNDCNATKTLRGNKVYHQHWRHNLRSTQHNLQCCNKQEALKTATWSAEVDSMLSKLKYHKLCKENMAWKRKVNSANTLGVGGILVTLTIATVLPFLSLTACTVPAKWWMDGCRSYGHFNRSFYLLT